MLIGLNKVPWSQMICGYMHEMETCEGGLYLGIEGNLVMIMKSCKGSKRLARYSDKICRLPD